MIIDDNEEFLFEIDADGNIDGVEEEEQEEQLSQEEKERQLLNLDKDEDSLEIDADGNIIKENSEDDNEEEEEEDDNDDDPKKKTQKPSGVRSNSSPVTPESLASALHTEGIISSLSDEDNQKLKTEGYEYIGELIRNEIKNNEFSDLPEDVKTAVIALRNGGKWEDFIQAKRTQIEFANIDENAMKGEENASARRTILNQYYKTTTKFSDDKIKREIDKIFESGNDEVEAIDALTELKEIAKNAPENYASNMKEQARLREEKAEASREKLKEIIKAKKEFIKGQAVTDATKNKVFESMTRPTHKLENGTPVNEVLGKYFSDVDFRSQLHHMYLITNGFQDLSKLTRTSKSSALKALGEKAKQEERRRENYDIYQETDKYGDDDIISAL